MRGAGALGLALVAGLVLASAARAADAEDPEVQIVEVRPEGPDLLVSFRVDQAFGPEVVERIESGMTVVFEHRLDLLVKRALPLMPARLLSRTIVETTARYDTLTRQYYLERRIRRQAPDESKDDEAPAATSATTERAEMEEWMTRVSAAPLTGPPAEGTLRKLRVRVRTEMGRRYRLLIFPFTDSAEAEQLLRP